MSLASFDQLLGQRLLRNQQIGQEDLDRALAVQRERPEVALGEILIDLRVCTQEALTLAFLQLYAQLNVSEVQRIRWARSLSARKAAADSVQPTA